MATIDRWFARLEDAVAIDRAVLGSWDLSVSHFGGAWHWRVECEGYEAAGGSARTACESLKQSHFFFIGKDAGGVEQ